jgi:hypothetical protein
MVRSSHEGVESQSLDTIIEDKIPRLNAYRPITGCSTFTGQKVGQCASRGTTDWEHSVQRFDVHAHCVLVRVIDSDQLADHPEGA